VGWRGYLTNDDPEEFAIFCPECSGESSVKKVQRTSGLDFRQQKRENQPMRQALVISRFGVMLVARAAAGSAGSSNSEVDCVDHGHVCTGCP
jgi:hypothetical protein